MTEEKKLPTIEEWFEENKGSDFNCVGMTVGFKSSLQSTFDDAVNYELKKYFSGKIFHGDGKGNVFANVEVTLDLVLSKDKDGKIVYLIDESRVELI